MLEGTEKSDFNKTILSSQADEEGKLMPPPLQLLVKAIFPCHRWVSCWSTLIKMSVKLYNISYTLKSCIYSPRSPCLQAIHRKVTKEIEAVAVVKIYDKAKVRSRR